MTDFWLRLMNRIDKILARELNISRTDAKSLIRRGLVLVDNTQVKSADFKCDDNAKIVVDGRQISNSEFVYIMMNKPKGVISASDGKGEKTVVDILPDNMKRRGLFPAGRLDKDTTGFVLITDNGELAHNILSPSHHIDKTYIARLDKPFNDEVVADFKGGMRLNGEELLEADIDAVDGDYTLARVVLRQGLYHQVKRMFKKHGLTVVELDRIKIGELNLDKSLKYGEARYITQDELDLITSK